MGEKELIWNLVSLRYDPLWHDMFCQIDTMPITFESANETFCTLFSKVKSLQQTWGYAIWRMHLNTCNCNLKIKMISCNLASKWDKNSRKNFIKVQLFVTHHYTMTEERSKLKGFNIKCYTINRCLYSAFRRTMETITFRCDT